MIKSQLIDEILSEQNIFTAIFALESYIFEVGLLEPKDQELYYALGDKYNRIVIEKTIKLCENRLQRLLKMDDFIELSVYFIPKKFDQDRNRIEYRPMHSAKLIDQICIVCMLKPLMINQYSIDQYELSDLSKTLPSNFYGNMPSGKIDQVFCDWRVKYKEFSENVIAKYSESIATMKFKYEVCLDIVNYFPSIDPRVVRSIVMDKFSVMFNEENLKSLNLVLTKLLHFRIKHSPEIESLYYRNVTYIDDNGSKGINYCNVGIPQGLPQAYFFGNLVMVEIANIYEKQFPGESFFYVDDCVIYTNDESANDSDFKNTIKSIETSINKSFDYFVSKISETESSCDAFHNSHKDISYKISIHKEGKSTSSKIQEEERTGMSFLKSIAINASRANMEITSTINENQDSGLLEKIRTLKEAIELELFYVKSHMNGSKDNISKDESNYLKLLQRYKKFFTYRQKILEFRDKIDFDTKFDEIVKKYLYAKATFTDEDIVAIFNVFDEVLFVAELSLMYKYSTNSNQRKKLNNFVKDFEKKMSCEIGSSGYFSKSVSQDFSRKSFSDEYRTLKSVCTRNMRNYSKVGSKIARTDMMAFIEDMSSSKMNKTSIINRVNIFLNTSNSYDEYVAFHSRKYIMMYINAIFSTFINVEISSDSAFERRDSRILNYYELRLLTFARSNLAEVEQFLDFARELILLTDDRIISDKIDHSVFEVLWYFVRFVRDPYQIDQLILTHKFVTAIWKNGSKHLYFYTQHNQEHSVELIKFSVDVIKTVDSLQLKNLDYFVLFLSCYLHDVSMVFIPDYSIFMKQSFIADKLLTQWRDDFERLVIEYRKGEIDHVIGTKKLILEFYSKISIFFEENVRGNHASLSSDFIRKSNELSFIEPTVKSFVASISEAHCFNSTDVYGLKSKAKADVISEKYLMMILRLADLLDMNKDRVSLNILKINARNMPIESKFHWISHAIVDKCRLRSQYTFSKSSILDKNANQIQGSYLIRENFLEKIVLDIYINTRNLSAVKSLECRNRTAKLNLDNNAINIEVYGLKSGKKCDGKCSLVCKWLNVKNENLFHELSELSQYLSENSANHFTTSIEVNYIFDKTVPLPSEFLDIVKTSISKQS